jgi:hypothetical protein
MHLVVLAVIYVIINLVILNCTLLHKVDCVSVLVARPRDKDINCDDCVI